MSTQNQSRKRKYTQIGSTGLNYPNVPHVPMDVVPSMIEAIKLSSKRINRVGNGWQKAGAYKLTLRLASI